MPAPKPGTRQRRWAPKVRTGCLTCKKRRKRCDEGKPFCHTCFSGGYVCDGYEKTPLRLSSLQDYDGTNTRSKKDPVDELPSQVIDPKTLSLLDRHDRGALLTNGHLNVTLLSCDVTHAQYFLVNVVPLLASTKQWNSFWEVTVPQTSMHNNAVYHALIALSETYTSRAMRVDRGNEIMRQVNLAVRATISKPISITDVLILCRLLASTSQCARDWKQAMIHLQNGWRILRESVRTGQVDPEIAQLLAPTFLGASTDRLYLFENSTPNSSRKGDVFECLEDVRQSFMTRFSTLRWHPVHQGKKSFILGCWSMITQINYSLAFPEYIPSSIDHEAISIQDIKQNLTMMNALLSLSQLREISGPLFRRAGEFLESESNDQILWEDIRHHVELFVENFLVKGMEINPDVKTWTCWHDYEGGTCDIDKLLPGSETSSWPGSPADADSSSSTPLAIRGLSPLSITKKARNGTVQQQKRLHYLEFVCPYRSGFMPTLVELD